MSRHALLAKVHIAKKELALTDEVYREVVWRVTGQHSAGTCADDLLVSLLDEFRRLGWKPAAAPKLRDENPHVRKIWALWSALARAGGVKGTSAALRAFVQRQTGVTDPKWLTPEQANSVIEGIKAMLARAKGAV